MADDRHHQPVPSGDHLSQLGKCRANDRGVGVDEHPDEQQPSPGELGEFGHPATSGDEQKLPRRGFFGIDDEIDTKLGDLVAQTRVRDPRNLLLDTKALSGMTGKDVHCVGRGHRDDQVRFAQPGLLQRLGACAVAGDDETVDAALQTLRDGGISLHHHNVLAFGGQPLGEVGADRPGTDDHDAHWGKSKRYEGEGTRSVVGSRRPFPYSARVRWVLLLFTLLATACTGAATETSTTVEPSTSAATTLASTTTAEVATTSSTSTTTTPVATVAVAAEDGIPAELASAVGALLSYAADDRNPVPAAPASLIEHLAQGDIPSRMDLNEINSATIADGSVVAVATTETDDVILAVDVGAGWQVVGAHLADGIPWYGDEPHMVLILGSDARPGQDPLRFHSDSIHVVTALPAQEAGSILGWPRDSFVPTPYGEMKITALMVGRGPEATRDQFRDYWDLPVSGYIVTGFRGFERLVGELGSVLIDIPRALPTQKWFAGFSSGEQRLNPVRALDYVRTRKGVPGGDLTRSSNQGVMMLAVLRMLQLNGIETVPDLLIALTEHTSTDLTAIQLLQLGASAFMLDPDSIENQVLPGSLGRAANNASVIFLDAEADDTVADLRDDGLLTPTVP